MIEADEICMDNLPSYQTRLNTLQAAGTKDKQTEPKNSQSEVTQKKKTKLELQEWDFEEHCELSFYRNAQFYASIRSFQEEFL